MGRDQRARAGRLNVDARSGQIQLVRNTGAGKILVVADMRDPAGRAGQVGGMGQPVDQVAADDPARRHVHADRPRRIPRAAPRILERFPRRLQKQPLLRIHEAGLLRRILEESRVEQIAVRQQRRRLDIGRVLQRFGRNARREELVIGEARDRTRFRRTGCARKLDDPRRRETGTRRRRSLLPPNSSCSSSTLPAERACCALCGRPQAGLRPPPPASAADKP